MRAQHKREYMEANPDKKLISLGAHQRCGCSVVLGSRRSRSHGCALTRCYRAGIGDTTEPLPPSVAKAMSDYCQALGTVEGYSGYDPPIEADVKAKVAEVMYKGMVDPSEVFVSDGSKCDLGRLQVRPHLPSPPHTQPNPPPALQLIWSADAEPVRVGVLVSAVAVLRRGEGRGPGPVVPRLRGLLRDVRPDRRDQRRVEAVR